MTNNSDLTLAVIIPSYKVSKHILSVIESIGSEVSRIYVVDDACPEKTGTLVKNQCEDSRVVVIFHEINQGVGGAVMTGYKQAIVDGYNVLVKLDGDGQMDAMLINELVNPILDGEADYTKGNRFFDLERIHQMPTIRIVGNALLSLMTKFSSGYWNLFDPTNGFTAIHSDVARKLPLSKISNRYFFETDLLFRLNTIRAAVVDVPMDAKYGDETSNLKISKILGEFLTKHVRNSYKRIFYNYYLRDLSIASIELPLGLFMLLFGLIFGSYQWINSTHLGVATPPGTVMLAALPVIIGLQFLLSFLAYDISSVPKRPIHKFRKIRLDQ